jgi:cytochrome c oxidase subunit 3
MVLAVDAGHQMKKDKVVLHVLTIIVVGSSLGCLSGKNFIKGEYGAIETKGGSLPVC